MNNIIQNIFGIMMLMLLPILIVISVITPEKTSDGYFTDPIKYWTDTQYYCDNFNPNYCRK